MKITDEWVRAVAPNAAAVRNGIALAGRFSSLRVSPDSALLYGEFQGSGAVPYTVQADLSVPESPVFLCSCPSRQRPCKHVLGLLLDFRASPERFASGPVPEGAPPRRPHAAQKRETAQMTFSLGEAVPAAASGERAALRAEGAELALRMALSLAGEGLGAQDAGTLARLRARTRSLGHYRVPGIQAAFARILRILGESPERAFEELSVFHLLCARARAYYTRRASAREPLDAALETWCGRVWHSTELSRM
ncbi:MAG: SWIM zinc finger domain-containing protein, partial [Oscillospiraceae bacterium]|nr:SWIM zinc finger domain-containing protein [Oscillospiraceae bacterium]